MDGFQINIMIKKYSALLKIKWIKWIQVFVNSFLSGKEALTLTFSECVFGGDKLVNWTSPASQDA